MTRALVVVAGIVFLMMPTAALAQGRGNGQGRGQGKPPGQGQPSNPPPSRNDLPTPAVVQSAAGVTPFAWIDDATLLEPRTVSIAMSIVRWSGSGVSEVDAPVIDAAIGVSRRLHLTATVPRVVGSDDPVGAAGGTGTSYIGAKVALVDPAKHRVKFTLSPLIEILSRGVVETSADGRRLHIGVPASAEIDSGRARLYVGTGFFSRGIWFAGAGAGLRATDTLFVSIGYNRSWRTSDVLDTVIASRARTEVTGGLAYAVATNISLFGSMGRTINTPDENGAGRTISGGVAFSFTPVIK